MKELADVLHAGDLPSDIESCAAQKSGIVAQFFMNQVHRPKIFFDDCVNGFSHRGHACRLLARQPADRSDEFDFNLFVIEFGFRCRVF